MIGYNLGWLSSIYSNVVWFGQNSIKLLYNNVIFAQQLNFVLSPAINSISLSISIFLDLLFVIKFRLSQLLFSF